MNFEILAPAGSMESLIAGVRSGANAIYLGGKSFNARRNAGNFDNEELKKAVEYCHSHGVKVYLTLNILVRDDEMENAYNTVRNALLCGVDAFIVQDIGVAKMIKEHFPSARLHGSTQMSIMTESGAKAAKEMGFSRIVLPREMSLEEIKEIREGTDLELELFVHGALCMSVQLKRRLTANNHQAMNLCSEVFFHAAALQTDISIPNSAKICLAQGKRKMLLQQITS